MPLRALRLALVCAAACAAVFAGPHAARGQDVTTDPLYVNWHNYYVAVDGNNYHMLPNIHDTSWKAVPILQAFLYDYELTRDATRMSAVLTRLEYMYDHRLANRQGQLGWVEVTGDPATDGTEHPSDSARILGCFLHFAEIVRRDPQMALYEPYAVKYVALGVEHYERFCPYFTQVDPAQGSGWVQRWPLYNPPGTRAGETMGHNKEADYADFLLRMYDLTGEARYADDAAAIGQWYKSQLHRNTTAAAYWWNYWDPAGSWDAGPYGGWAHWTWVEHRGGYGSLDMEMVAALYDRGLVYTELDMRRFINSQLKLSWQGDHNPPTFWLSDGSEPDWDPPVSGSGALHPALIRYGDLTPVGYPTLESLMLEIWDVPYPGNSWSDLGRAPTYLLWKYGSAIPQGPMVTGWEILSDHGPLGEIPMALGDGHVEPRRAGVRKLRVSFSSPVADSSTGQGAVTLVGQAHGDQSGRIEGLTLDAGKSHLTIALSSALPDADSYVVALTAVVQNEGGTAVAGDVSRTVRCLAGDVNGSGVVTEADILAVRARAGEAAAGSALLSDVNGSGRVTAGDMLAVRRCAGHQLP